MVYLLWQTLRQRSKKWLLHNYRPQRSWGKVIFLEACVKNSVHGAGVVSQYALQVSRPTTRVEVEGSGLGGSPGPHPGGSVGGSGLGGLQAHTQGGGWGVWSSGVSKPTPGGVSQHTLRQTPPKADGYCCGRYASYWNAFLLCGGLYTTQRWRPM